LRNFNPNPDLRPLDKKLWKMCQILFASIRFYLTAEIRRFETLMDAKLNNPALLKYDIFT